MTISSKITPGMAGDSWFAKTWVRKQRMRTIKGEEINNQLETKYKELRNLGPINIEPINFFGF